MWIAHVFIEKSKEVKDGLMGSEIFSMIKILSFVIAPKGVE
jgi:hypothetical protein